MSATQTKSEKLCASISSASKCSLFIEQHITINIIIIVVVIIIIVILIIITTIIAVNIINWNIFKMTCDN